MLAQSTSSSLPYDRQKWGRGYESQPNEYDYWIDRITGTIPPNLEGTLLRNGGGLLDIGDYPLSHPFDGDGMVSAIAFQGGRVHYRNRYVRTQGYVAEQQAGKPLYRGVFGSQKPGGWLANIFDLRLKNIANTNIIQWSDRLLALWEGGQPHRLDPQTLDTLGLDNLDGLLKSGQAFSAHPRIDPIGDGGRPCFINFSIQPGLSSTLTVWELGQEGNLLHQRTEKIPGFCFIHDFAITENFYIFFQNSVTFNPLPFILGQRGPGECIDFDRQNPTKVWLIPRRSDRPAEIIDVESGFVFHHVNAFERGNDTIVIDSIGYDAFPEVEPGSDFRQTDFSRLPPSQLWRFQLDLTRKTGDRQLLEEGCCEFPQVHPQWVGRENRYSFMGVAEQQQGSGPLQRIMKRDNYSGERQVWSAAPDGFVSEPIFVPYPDSQAEDEGWLLSVVYDGDRHRSDIVILEGENITRGPVARLHLQHHIPYGLHGSWVQDRQLGIG